MEELESDEKLLDFQKDVKEAIEAICYLAVEREWTYMVLFGACKSLAETTNVVLQSGLAWKWDSDDRSSKQAQKKPS